MNNDLIKQIQMSVQKLVNGTMIYSDDVPSSILEGQYGGETWEEKFTELTFYLQYTPEIENFTDVADIIQAMTQECRVINQRSDPDVKYFIFDENTNSVKQIRSKLNSKNSAAETFYRQELNNFKNGIGIIKNQSLVRHITRIDENGLVVFITGKSGWELDVKELRRVKEQSLWFRLSHDRIELFHSFPVKDDDTNKALELNIKPLKNIQIKGEHIMNTWLHRISHCYEVSKELLDQNYLTIGFADYVACFEASHGDLKKLEKSFEQDMENIYGNCFRQRFNLRKFLFEFKKGDRVLVPSWGTFSVYQIVEEAKPLTQLPTDVLQKLDIGVIFDNRGLISYTNPPQDVDLGFFIKVEAIKLSIPRDEYANSKLISRMKIRNATANISDLNNDIDEAIARFSEKRPIDFHREAITALTQNLIDTIMDKRRPDQFEKLVKWYFTKIGADETRIPPKNERGKSDYADADADVIAIFETLKCIIYVQVKHHNGNTSQWAIEQITKYKNQFEDPSNEYTYFAWVISSGCFAKDVCEKARSVGVRLIDGNAFAEMLIDVGLKDVNDAFSCGDK